MFYEVHNYNTMYPSQTVNKQKRINLKVRFTGKNLAPLKEIWYCICIFDKIIFCWFDMPFKLETLVSSFDMALTVCCTRRQQVIRINDAKSSIKVKCLSGVPQG